MSGDGPVYAIAAVMTVGAVVGVLTVIAAAVDILGRIT